MQILKKIALGGLTALPLAVISCSVVTVKQSENAAWKTNVSFAFEQSWYQDKGGNREELTAYERLFSQTFNDFKNADPELKNFADANFSIVAAVADDNLSLNNVISSNYDFAFVSAKFVENNDLNKLRYYPMVQTLTEAFHFDEDEKANQVAVATKMQAAFDKKPFMEWTQTGEQWNGSRWNFLYSTNKLVNFYRGMVVISGDETTRNSIKTAWNNRDWNTFRNFGIQGIKKFKLFQAYFKNHFNLPNNTFTTLEEDQLQHPNKYSNLEYFKVGQDPEFRISLDDEASFAWTKNTNIKPSDTTIKFQAPSGEKLEFLTVSPIFKYDVGVFAKTFNKQQAELILKTMEHLAKQGKDIFGPKIGYNGYEKYKAN
ncbi:ABC transporter thiamine pyrophosphate-binding lipoprotein p37/Cypl [Candidatus Mycoplasma pogonae]